MKYDQINKQLFVENRRNFIARMKPNSIAVFNSNDQYLKNADAHHAFRQNSDLFWLSGIDQEESMLILFPDAPNEAWREVLFLRQTNETIAIWEGYKYTMEHAESISGIASVKWNSSFSGMLETMTHYAENIYLNTNEHDRASVQAPYKDIRFAQEMIQRYPLHKYERAAPILTELRAVKHPIEIELMQQACNITEKAFRRLLSFVKPGVWEYEIEAELIHEYIRNRANGHAYDPIIASGPSACVLHYVENNRQCKDGDLLLIDSGADYANYASDMTRTIPVSGRFTARQRDVYNAVLRIMREASQMLQPGVLMDEYHNEVCKIMESELVGLKLLSKEEIAKQDKNNPAFRKYFMHGTSHFLGIDVHDIGNRYQKMKENMVFTVEPGIYIREEGIGIRLENNIVVKSGGKNLDLMAGIPVDAEEIEELMNSNILAAGR